MATFVITKHDDHYSVATDVLMSDGRLQADNFMELQGTTLRFKPCQPGWIRAHAPFALTLGPKSYAKVTALTVGASVTITT